MPDPKKKTKIPKYSGATKVDVAPTGEGWSPGETIGTKTYYEKEAEKAKSGVLPSKETPAWKQSMIKMLQSGVSPEKLAEAGHIDPKRIEEFRPYYKAVYTEPEKKATATAADQPYTSQVSAQNMVSSPTGPGHFYLEFPDPVAGGYSGQSGRGNIQRRYFDKEGKEFSIPSDPMKLYDASGKITTYTGKTYSDYSGTNVRSRGTGETMLLPNKGGAPVTEKGQTITNAPERISGFKRGGMIGYNKGGLVAKMRKYADGGDVSGTANVISGLTPMLSNLTGALMNRYKGSDVNAINANVDQQYQKQPQRQFQNVYNQNYNSPGFNKGGLVKKYADGGGVNPSLASGIGLAGDVGSQLISGLTTDQYGRTKTGSETGDYAAGIGGGALKGAASGAALGPIGMAVGAGIGGITGGLKTFADRKSIQQQQDAENLAKQKAARAKSDVNYDYLRNKALQERGFNKGGLVNKLAKGGNMDEMIENHNNNHLNKRVKEIGREAAMQEYNDYFAGSNKKQFRIK